MDSVTICATCAVEHEAPLPSVCAICADDRQYVPAGGQAWTTLAELDAVDTWIELAETEPDLIGARAVRPAHRECETPGGVGIGQTGQVARTPEGSLLWDPPGFVDDGAVAALLDHGPVLAVAASHPHMFGVQLEWARRLAEAAGAHVPVLVNARDAGWLARTGPEVQTWDEHVELADGLSLHRVGGHFPGSAVARWRAPDGATVLLTGDSVFPNPDRASVGFMRSYPNKIPLSGAVVRRIADAVVALAPDRIVGNFANRITADAAAVVAASADRHIAWVSGDLDHLT